MKRFLALLLTLCLMCACLSVQAEADADQAYDPFASRVGNIFFTMPKNPMEVVHDADLTRTGALASVSLYMGWTGKTQLLYHDSQGEWQYHIADISATAAQVRADYPDSSELTIQVNALMHFALMSLSLTGVDISGLTPQYDKITDGTVKLPRVIFDFTYSDMPDTPYRCIGLMDGTQAVLLIGSVDDRYQAMADVFGIITPEQAEDIAQRLVPDEQSFGPLQFTMPAQSGIDFDVASVYCLCFTEQYHLLSVEYMPVDFAEMLGMDTFTEEDVLAFAESAAEGTLAEGGFVSADTDLFAPGIARVKMITEPSYSGEQEEYWFIIYPYGCYTIHVPVASDGQALLDSIRVNPDADPYKPDFTWTLLIAMANDEE